MDQTAQTQVVMTLSLAIVGHLAVTTNGAVDIHQTSFIRQDSRCAGKVIHKDNCPVTMVTKNTVRCASLCGRRGSCESWLLELGEGVCHLCNATASPDCSNTVNMGDDVTAWDKVKECEHGGQWVSGRCQCPRAYGGDHCQTRMTDIENLSERMATVDVAWSGSPHSCLLNLSLSDCEDWVSEGYNGTGVLWIYPQLSDEPFPVNCEGKFKRQAMARRIANNVDFYRNWTEYVEGFGDLSGDHWLGLRRIHQISSSHCTKMLTQYNMANGTFFLHLYRNFLVLDEANNFALSSSLASGFGNGLDDCLGDVRGKPFSTYDADHDDDVSGNCAERHHSGWWFGNCTLCNPTGVLTTPDDMLRSGVDWEVFWTPGLGQLSPRTVRMYLFRC